MRRQNRWQRIGLLCLLLFLLPVQAGAAAWDGSWFYHEEKAVPFGREGQIADWHPYDHRKRPPLSPDSHVVWLSVQLPDDAPDRNVLMFLTTNQAVRVWLDRTMIYTWGEFRPTRFDQGTVFHRVALPGDFAGKQLKIELYAAKNRQLGIVHLLSLDTPSRQVQRIFLYDLPVILALPAAAAMILLMLLCQYFYSGRWNRLYSFVIGFLFVFSCWLVSAAKVRSLFFDHPVFWWYMLSILAYLLPLSANLMLSELLKDKPYARMKLVTGANALLFLLAAAGELLGLHSMNDLMDVFYPLLAAGETAAMYWCWRAARQGNRLCRAVMVPLAAFTLLGLLDGMAGHFRLFTWHTFLTPLAIYAFLYFVIAILREKLRREHRLAVHNAGLEREAARALQRAETDVLTGCWNRSVLNRLLASSITEAVQSGGHGFAVLLLDIDHFKRVNDQFGHVAGDRVLAAFAQMVRSSMGPGCSCIRWGGEEFMILMDMEEREAVVRQAQLLRRKTESADLGGHRITCSIGVAFWHGRQDTPDALFKRVDTALYRAKQEGRNRVVLAGED